MAGLGVKGSFRGGIEGRVGGLEGKAGIEDHRVLLLGLINEWNQTEVVDRGGRTLIALSQAAT
jgi:hypothetical protein